MATLRYRSLEDLNYVTNTLIARIDDWKTTNITICYEVSENLLRQAAVHRRTGDMEREYIALMKFARFVYSQHECQSRYVVCMFA